MKTLSVPEASRDLAAVLAEAIAGEDIRIRSGNHVVALRPTTFSDNSEAASLTPREAFERLQADAQLSLEQAQDYLREVHAEWRARPCLSRE